MNWFLNMISEISENVIGEGFEERDQKRARQKGANDNASIGQEHIGPAANDEQRRKREGYGEISDWDW